MSIKEYEMKLLMGIDLGTSSVKTIIISLEGKVVASATEEYGMLISQKGYAEQNPTEWWEKTSKSIKNAIDMLTIKEYSIIGIGLSGQMHSMVMLDEKCEIIRPSIIWCDQRMEGRIGQINDVLSKDDFSDILLNPIASGFQIASLLWVIENEYDNYKKTRHIISPKDFIRYKLTGQIGSEPSDAASTLLFDIKQCKWANSIMKKFKIDIDLFPKIGNSFSIAGYTSDVAKKDCNLPYGIPVVYGGGDQPVQAIGNGIISEGLMSSTVGTGGQLFSVVDTPKYDLLYRTHTFNHVIENKWYIMGASLASGLSIRWLRDNILGRVNYDEMNKVAAKHIPGSGGLLFLPYLIGERTPHMDPGARGMFCGLTVDHDWSNMVAAVFEGIVFALRGSFDIIKELGVNTKKVIASGGGAKSALILQIQANVFKTEIYKSNIEEQAAFGAAILGGVGAGSYSSIEQACMQLVRYSKTVVEPQKEAMKYYDDLYEIYKSLYTNNKDTFRRLNKLCFPKK